MAAAQLPLVVGLAAKNSVVGGEWIWRLVFAFEMGFFWDFWDQAAIRGVGALEEALTWGRVRG